MTKKTISILILLCFLLPTFSFSQGEENKSFSYPTELPKEVKVRKRMKFSFDFAVAREEEGLIKAPENVEEVKALGEKALAVGEKELPGIIEKIWREEVLPIWQKMYRWFKTNIWPKIESWIQGVIKPEVEKRKPAVEEEFKKEKGEIKTEVKQELPKIWQSLWQKFLELIK